jgi:hypothetical protein
MSARTRGLRTGDRRRRHSSLPAIRLGGEINAGGGEAICRWIGFETAGLT